MQNIMLQTKLPKEICAKVWDLSNPAHGDQFSKTMFMVAIHLLYKIKKDPSLQLPDKIPSELISSVDEDSLRP